MYWFRERVPQVLSWRKERDTSRSKELRRRRNSVYYARYDWWRVFLQRKWYSSYFFLAACRIQTTKDLYRTKVEHLSKNGNKHLSILRIENLGGKYSFPTKDGKAIFCWKIWNYESCTMHVLWILQLRRHLGALQKMQEYGRRRERKILGNVQKRGCFCRKGLEGILGTKVRTTYLSETMGKHRLSILRESLQKHIPLVRLYDYTYM